MYIKYKFGKLMMRNIFYYNLYRIRLKIIIFKNYYKILSY